MLKPNYGLGGTITPFHFENVTINSYNVNNDESSKLKQILSYITRRSIFC